MLCVRCVFFMCMVSYFGLVALVTIVLVYRLVLALNICVPSEAEADVGLLVLVLSGGAGSI